MLTKRAFPNNRGGSGYRDFPRSDVSNYRIIMPTGISPSSDGSNYSILIRGSPDITATYSISLCKEREEQIPDV